MDNPVLQSIRERRSVTNFLPSKMDNEAIEQILEAGRWAPSWINSQPWKFIVITEKELKRKVGEIGSLKTFFSKALGQVGLILFMPWHFRKTIITSTSM